MQWPFLCFPDCSDWAACCTGAGQLKKRIIKTRASSISLHAIIYRSACHISINHEHILLMVQHVFRHCIWLLMILVAITTATAHGREISSYAFVNEDGTLGIKGNTIHLYGIHIPDTGRHCRTNIRPVICGSRAVLALEFKIQGFVRCEIKGRNDDGSLIGRCRVNATTFDDGTDLSAYLLERGWAVATPDAPLEYQTLEKIAYRRGVGVWGFHTDDIIIRRR